MKNKCYFCSSDSLEIVKKGIRDNKNISVYRCAQCGLIFIPNALSDEYYKENKLPTEGDTMSSIDTERRFKEYSELFRNKKILDFGCGEGRFLQKIKEADITNHHISALEPNKKYRKDLAEKFSLYLNIDTLPNDYFDYITMFHVLEHLEDPVNILKQLKNKLTDKGQLIIEVPNRKEALIALYNNNTYSNLFYVPWHLFYLDRNSLKNIIEKAEFVVEFIKQIQRYSLSNHLYWMACNEPCGHLIWGFLNDTTLNDKYASKLAELDMCDTLVALVSK